MKTDLLITLTHETDNENNVTLAFAMGNTALQKGHSVQIILLSYAVQLARKDFAKIDIGAPFKPIAELIPAFLEGGGVLKVCQSCMEHNGVASEDIMEGAIIIQADNVIDSIMASDKTLQLN